MFDFVLQKTQKNVADKSISAEEEFYYINVKVFSKYM